MATEHPTTTSRRSALQGLAAIAAGLGVPALATAPAAPDADAELIALCTAWRSYDHTKSPRSTGWTTTITTMMSLKRPITNGPRWLIECSTRSDAQ